MVGEKRNLLIFCLVLVLLIGIFLTNALYRSMREEIPPPSFPDAGFDNYRQSLPWLTFSRQTIRAGSFPLWNPYQAIGQPLFAQGQTGVLYPVNWLAFVFEGPLGILLIQCFTVAFAMTGTALFLWYLRADWSAIIEAAMIVGFCAFRESFFLTYGSAYSWLPWVLLLTHRVLEKPNFSRSIVLAISLSLCYLAGSPQHFYYHCCPR
jgi:hypothetical protein